MKGSITILCFINNISEVESGAQRGWNVLGSYE